MATQNMTTGTSRPYRIKATRSYPSGAMEIDFADQQWAGHTGPGKRDFTLVLSADEVQVLKESKCSSSCPSVTDSSPMPTDSSLKDSTAPSTPAEPSMPQPMPASSPQRESSMAPTTGKGGGKVPAKGK